MRHFVFRAWDKKVGKFSPLNLWLLDPAGVVRWQYDNSYAGDRLVVQQYTGLKDRSGKDIYEGDIVENMGHWRKEIIFENGRFDFKTIRMLGCGVVYDDSPNPFSQDLIIGNIFENPELL